MKIQNLGVILAGGKSRRFGSPKAFAKKDGLPFYQYSMQAIKPHTDSQIMITSIHLKNKFKETIPSLNVLTDHHLYAGKGPLAGLYTAMLNEQAKWYVTVPVDVPYVEPWVINGLLQYTSENIQAIIPVTTRMHPLIAVYHHSIKEKLKDNLDNDKLSVRELLDIINVQKVPFKNEQPFININSQVDFDQFIK